MTDSLGTQETMEQVSAAAGRVAKLGQWPAWIAPESLTTRVPTADQTATGFDAGIACALDLIPREHQELAARLHAAYTPEAVEQVRREIQQMEPNSDTTWWLAACSVCTEGKLTFEEFAAQVKEFKEIASDSSLRLACAQEALEQMCSSYELQGGVPMALVDGGMQGAYIDGHDIAGQYAAEHDLYFLGTFRPSLGLEDFAWEQPADPAAEDVDARMGRSGPVHGSKQFVKCASLSEYERASYQALHALQPPPPRPHIDAVDRLASSYISAGELDLHEDTGHSMHD